MKTTKIFLSLTLAMFLANSCRKDDTTLADSSPDQETTQFAGKAEFTNNNDIDIALDAAYSNGDLNRNEAGQINPSLVTCATVTVQNTNGGFPKVYTVDFGTVGCTNNGITRKGKLIMTLSNKISTPGSILSIVRQNYYVNDDAVEGTIVFKNLTTVSTVPTWSKTVTGGKITKPNGNHCTYTSEKAQRMIAGAGTPDPLDDVFEIFQGTTNVIRNNGNTLKSSIKSSLIKSKSCQYISKGILTLTGTHLDGNLNYGNGDCDDKATYTDANGHTFVITLR